MEINLVDICENNLSKDGFWKELLFELVERCRQDTFISGNLSMSLYLQEIIDILGWSDTYCIGYNC